MSVILIKKVEDFKNRWKSYVAAMFEYKLEGDEYTVNLLRMKFGNEVTIVDTITANTCSYGVNFDGQYYNDTKIGTVHAIFAAEAVALKKDCSKYSIALAESVNMGIFNDVINSQLDSNSYNINYSSSSSSDW